MRLTVLIMVLTAGPLRADDWAQWMGPRRDGVWREAGVIEKFPEGGPKVLWRVPVAAGYAGPAVADGRVFVPDRRLEKGARNPRNAFGRSKVPGNERLLCLDAKTGRPLWKYEYPCEYKISYASGPRCTPTVDGDRVYFLGAMGDLACLDVKTGKKIWGRDFVKEFDGRVPVWGHAAHPLIDGDKLICLVGGSSGRCVMAFDKNTGATKWGSMTINADIGYCPPIIKDINGKRQLIVWHGEAANGLDPETGEVIWSHPWRTKAALTAPLPRVKDDKILLIAFYEGSRLLKIDGDKAAVVWRSERDSERPNRSTKLHSIMPSPFWVGEHIYGVGSYGELRCLDEKTGKRVWSTREPTTGGAPVRWANVFLTPTATGKVWYLFNEGGELITAKLTPAGYEEIDRADVIEPTNRMAGRPVVWVHPAFAGKKMYVRNDKELVCLDLSAQ